MKTVALYLAPDFSLFHFAISQMVFSTRLDEPLFKLRIVAETPVVSLADGITVRADGGLELFWQADIVVVPAWNNYEDRPGAALKRALQQANERGVTIVGLCLGAYALAYSGLLDGKKAATHWMGESDFHSRFPQVQLDMNALYVRDGNVITSAGTAAGLDCCLAIVREIHGVKTANKLARLFVTSPHREGGQAQFIEQPLSRKTSNETINELLDYLRENLRTVNSVDNLAHRLSMSRSTFTRRFRKATGTSVTQWLINTKLQKGCELLESTQLSIETVAEQIGFQSAVSFRQHFVAKYKISPREYRRSFGEFRK